MKCVADRYGIVRPENSVDKCLVKCKVCIMYTSYVDLYI